VKSPMHLPDRMATTRLLMRPFEADDVPAVFEYASDPEYIRYQSGPDVLTREIAETFVADLMSRDRLQRPAWAITIDDRVVGIANLMFEGNHRVAVLGYGLRRNLWGRGFAREAVRAVLEAAFRDCEPLRRVRAHTDARNLASTRLLSSIGFRHEGTLRRNQLSRGEEIDEAICGLLREEWPGHSEVPSRLNWAARLTAGDACQSTNELAA
jgi:ribosomal-protein-alanine N-acetyltransferase